MFYGIVEKLLYQYVKELLKTCLFSGAKLHTFLELCKGFCKKFSLKIKIFYKVLIFN